ANVVEKDEAGGALMGPFSCTSGAIQKGVPTEVFLLRRVFVSCADTPAGMKIHASVILASSLSGGNALHLSIYVFLFRTKTRAAA
ncbi:hypothetical protein XENOCAPTIV_013096, partial [Xenoophorus captivus]